MQIYRSQQLWARRVANIAKRNILFYFNFIYIFFWKILSDLLTEKLKIVEILHLKIFDLTL